ncbi:5'-3' exoribonuclease 3-like [Heracleum sosnowskyi]|uniref:5'-3' exoribonuclease 3-like n=1 Tax=Heracleum sosnowskyi TaxID=360622 RepID=A0AAD8H226_9APIA|nr:5'-3' exoribonuclease 3-like [Heracleum sosnowskyi]
MKTKLKGILHEKSDAFNSENPEEEKAPFASDLKDLGQLNISFQLGSPFKPFNQLLSVFPAASSHALPQQYKKLTTDPNSPIIDFYPADFEVDMNGKRFAWQGIAKLPFIDEDRLLAEVAKIEYTLTNEEVRRNSTMHDMLFVAISHPLSPYIFSFDDRCKQLDDKEHTQMKEKLDPGASDGMNGYISLCSGEPCLLIFRSPVEGMEDIMDNNVIYSGRKLWENRRNNPPGAISGMQLGDAAHRLVANSLQIKKDRNFDRDYNGHPPFATAHGPTFHPNKTNRHQGRGQYRSVPPNSAYSQGHHMLPYSDPGQSQYDRSHNQPCASSSTRHPDNRHHPPLSQSRDYPPQVNYSQGSHQKRHVYQPRVPLPAVQALSPVAAGVPFHQQVGYQTHGGTNYHHKNGGP